MKNVANMKLNNPKITILFGSDSTTIELHDSPSSTTFLRVKLTPEQLSSALSRLSYTSCEAEISGVDRIGKTLEFKKIEFPLSSNGTHLLKDTAKKEQYNFISEGWESDCYFNSQDSFFTKDGIQHARVTVRRWV